MQLGQALVSKCQVSILTTTIRLPHSQKQSAPLPESLHEAYVPDEPGSCLEAQLQEKLEAAFLRRRMQLD
jgi:hypothetical protein